MDYFPITYVLSSDSLADNLGVFIHENLGLGSGLIDSPFGEGYET